MPGFPPPGMGKVLGWWQSGVGGVAIVHVAGGRGGWHGAVCVAVWKTVGASRYSVAAIENIMWAGSEPFHRRSRRGESPQPVVPPLAATRAHTYLVVARRLWVSGVQMLPRDVRSGG